MYTCIFLLIYSAFKIRVTLKYIYYNEFIIMNLLLENIPDTIVRDDLVNYSQCSESDLLNYKHIFNKIGEGNIFYPECFLYPNKEEINLYGGYCKNGYHNRVTYNIKEQKYIFNREYESEKILIFNTKLWVEMYEYIHKYFYLNY